MKSKSLLKSVLLTTIFLSVLNCGSKDDDCTKTITIPQFYLVGNQSYSYDIEQEVDCDFPEPSEPQLIDPPVLENFSYDVLSFIYTADTGNNTSRLQFEIQLNNGNNYSVEGVPILTINSDGLVFSGSYSNLATTPCYSIAANSNCILSVSIEDSLDLGAATSVQLLNVRYFLIN